MMPRLGALSSTQGGYSRGADVGGTRSHVLVPMVGYIVLHVGVAHPVEVLPQVLTFPQIA